ncbi:MAG: type I phosphomannose isomerase catalytic subunit [Flavobacterium sp.]|uniref:type I phosphomannose isomerase catalytic subunit n=1 Tax=Flavobacterium sp. TaxID=239 RepID=UPI0032650BF2
MSTNCYPLVFESILKERIWGGTKLQSILEKKIISKTTGESWEISQVTGDVSIVKNGLLKGKTLNELLEEYPEEILGTKVYKQFGKQFPLLFKFLDAHEDLSIQVHPNDELAKKRHNSFGKTEMWYIMQADEEASIIVGFKEKSSPKEYLQHLENKTLTTILEEISVKKGDVFFLETGTIHAIGAGILIAEIQQTSDITYRIYDFDRKDAQGNSRELHNDLALEAINYNKIESRKKYNKTINTSNKAVNCPYFTTNFIPLDGEMIFKGNSSSFKVFMCTEGEFYLVYNNEKQSFKKGETILLPAVITHYTLIGKASILEIYIS